MISQPFKLIILFIALMCALSAPGAHALTLPLPSDGDVIGSVQEGVARGGDETLADVGRRYDIGAHEMALANPSITHIRKLYAGTKVIIPSQFILPAVPRKGIVINLAELRLYYYPTDRDVVVTQPIGIGKEGNWKTPVGVTKITAKVEDPYWHPTANVRAEALKHGTPIPSVFPPGPDNPLGKYILRLGWPTYLIHGTNHPEGVGARVSAGCIRMLPQDAKDLYDTVPVGTEVRVINEPYKAGWRGNKLYFEAHPPLSEDKSRFAEDKSSIIDVIQAQLNDVDAVVRWEKVYEIIKNDTGIPELIGGK